jgi:hypothetical protein
MRAKYRWNFELPAKAKVSRGQTICPIILTNPHRARAFPVIRSGGHCCRATRQKKRGCLEGWPMLVTAKVLPVAV